METLDNLLTIVNTISDILNPIDTPVKPLSIEHKKKLSEIQHEIVEIVRQWQTKI